MLEGISAAICRDDNCHILEVHARHFIAQPKPTRPHHRPKKIKCSRCEWRGQASLERAACPKCFGELVAVREVQPWEVHDERALMRSIASATSKAFPVTFSMIYRDVLDDYGTVDERTIHRYLARLVDRGCLLKYHIDLPFAVYVRPGTRLDYTEICEYEYINVETPTQAKRRKLKRELSAAVHLEGGA